MKALLFAAVLAFAGAARADEAPPEWASPLVAGDWGLAAQNADTVVFAKDPDPRVGPQGYRRIQARFEFAAPHPGEGQKTYLSLMVLIEFDCAQGKSRNVQAQAFAGHNLTKPLGDPVQEASEWSDVEQSSIASILQKDACND